MNERSIITSDWHFGANSNDTKHNQDLLEFVDYLVSYGKTHNIDVLYFAGDLFEHRDKVDVQTLNYAISGIETLSQQFDVRMLLGNHDLYYKDTLDITSLSVFDKVATVIHEPQVFGNILVTPWVINQEQFEHIVQLSKSEKVDYVIGHYEFSGFKMNDHYVMEHGYSHKALKHLKQVFTGHYHARQEKGNVVYIGSPFPFNFNDSNDSKRGFIDFDPTNNPSWNWIDYNRVHVIEVDSNDYLSGVCDTYDPSKTKIKIVFSEKDMNEKQLESVKEKLAQHDYRQQKIDFKSLREKRVIEQDSVVGEIKSVDGMVIDSLKNMTPVEGIEPSLLIDLYLDARENG